MTRRLVQLAVISPHLVGRIPRRTLTASHATRGKIQPFLLADIGEGIAEVQLLSWSIKEGNRVEEFDEICEVQSDKATADITSRYKGLVKKLYAKTGDTVRVGQPLCDIELDDDSATPFETPIVSEAPAPPEASTSAAVSESTSTRRRALAAPAVRRIARERKIDIDQIRGTGRDGRVTREDMTAFVDSDSAPGRPLADSAIGRGSAAVTSSRTQLDPVRRAMFKAMSASLQIPHFAFSEEVDVTELEKVRRQLNHHIPAKYRRTSASSNDDLDERIEAGARFDRITLLPLLIKAMSCAMAKHPLFLSSVSSTADGTPELVHRASHDISIALSAPSGGLYTVLLPSVDTLSPFDIAARIAQMQTLVNAPGAPRLPPQLLKAGTITLSNVGTVGGTYTHPVIPPTGQLAIGALGRTIVQPRYLDTIAAREAALANVPLTAMPRIVLPVSFTADHRIVEGVELARLVEDWRSYVEQPGRLIGECT